MKMNSIDLVMLGNPASPPSWSGGALHVVEATPEAVNNVVQTYIARSTSDAWLFWDASTDLPNPDLIRGLLATSSDVWHAGLSLGVNGLPGAIDFVAPTWMFNRDPSPDVEATSWRISLRACVVRTSVLREMSCVRPEFKTLEGAALEMGHRYLMMGVLIRHIPALVRGGMTDQRVELPIDDELRFVYYRYGIRWGVWFLLRALLSRYATPGSVFGAWCRVRQNEHSVKGAPYRRNPHVPQELGESPRVTVLIPTLDRNKYIRTLLNQVRDLSIAPAEVIVIDQTPSERRDQSLAEDFSDLPLILIRQEQPGQCSARNLGLLRATGQFILFLDDDDEIEPSLIASHLQNLKHFQADISCGRIDEVGVTNSGEGYSNTRASDVFPTGNSLVSRDALRVSGLFDLAYDCGRNEDGDLGMRFYLAGKLAIFNPRISVRHHRAPVGGLRTHNARVVTYASSRRKLQDRNIPSISEIYLYMRYFTRRQLIEILWIQAVGTLSTRGGSVRKFLKKVLGLVCLPNTLWHIYNHWRLADSMFDSFPKIPSLN